jgi:hypothetical protein
VGLAFGSGDQYLGSLVTPGGWTESLSLLSAPWLVLPFAFGCGQVKARQAATAGLVVTMTALLGYFLMIMGPFEGGQWNLSLHEARGLFLSNTLNIFGGFVTGPLYGFLGQRWRTQRAWISAVLVAGALCLEPFALTLAGRTLAGRSSTVWTLETAAGIATAGYFALAGLAYRRRRSGLTPPT